ncbi:hypothetical protein G6F50_017225 [Rhizopus delemar]|uniref:Uncharacterized protein n=1 Tax=Rhizopus delemar TaxID=936053 RepID=A0A9P6XQQ5_9FUNG|nr:hypothetical protein G6F50_017225 [Rhizopus delemar]
MALLIAQRHADAPRPRHHQATVHGIALFAHFVDQGADQRHRVMRITARDECGVGLQRGFHFVVWQCGQDGEATRANTQRVPIARQQHMRLQGVVAVFAQDTHREYIAPKGKEGGITAFMR